MFRHLLVAIDETPAAHVALSFATAVARDEGGSVHVLYANRMLVGGRGLAELSGAEATALVDTAVLQLLEQGIEATGSVSTTTTFTIGQVIAAAAQARRCDAVLVGSQRRSGRWHLFGRGTRERIIRHSTLPVLTAPAPLRIPRRRRRSGTESAWTTGASTQSVR
jgi:nucleotide-binding universal stress UspA family protein